MPTTKRTAGRADGKRILEIIISSGMVSVTVDGVEYGMLPVSQECSLMVRI